MSRVIIPKSAIDLVVEKSAKPLREIAEPRLINEFKKINLTMFNIVRFTLSKKHFYKFLLVSRFSFKAARNF